MNSHHTHTWYTVESDFHCGRGWYEGPRYHNKDEALRVYERLAAEALRKKTGYDYRFVTHTLETNYDSVVTYDTTSYSKKVT